MEQLYGSLVFLTPLLHNSPFTTACGKECCCYSISTIYSSTKRFFISLWDHSRQNSSLPTLLGTGRCQESTKASLYL